jgi:hypothetical protein
MSQSTTRVDTTSSSSSSLSNQASFQQNPNLTDLAGHLASYLNIGKLSETLTNLIEQIAYLDRKVDQKFGEMEKPFLYASDPKTLNIRDQTSIPSFSSFPSRNRFPELVSKDSQKLREKVRGEILKDHKLRISSSPIVEDVIEPSSSSSFTQILSSSLKKSNLPILDVSDEAVLNELGMEKADIFYYKMEPEFKEDLDNMIKSHSSIFGEKKLVPPIHNNKGDITGYMMQKNAQNFAALGEIFYKFALNNDIERFFGLSG